MPQRHRYFNNSTVRFNSIKAYRISLGCSPGFWHKVKPTKAVSICHGAMAQQGAKSQRDNCNNGMGDDSD